MLKLQRKSKIYSKLLTLVIPIAFQQFMLALVGACDAMMLGKISQNLLSAASLAGQITFVYNLFLVAMTIGTSIFAAQYYGKGDFDSVEKVLALVIRITFMISLVFFAATILCPTVLMRIFTTDSLLIQEGSIYLRIVSTTYLMCSVSQIYLCIMKNSQKAVKSMIISSVTVVVNIGLNAVFIFGLLGFPQMNIAGAALATAVARLIEVSWTFIENGKKGSIKIRLMYLFHPDKQLTHDFWKYTFPVLGNEIVWGCGFTMYSVVMGHLGTDAVAANSIANIIKNLIACLCIGLGNGSGIIVGNELGAGNLEKAKEYGRMLCKLSIWAGILSGLLLLLIMPLVLQVTNLTPQAKYYLKGMLVICSYYLIGKSVNSTTIAGIFCAGGDSKFGFLCDAITMWCITVPLGLLTGFVLKLPVLSVYFFMNLDEIIKLPAVYRHYKKYRWVKNLTRKEKNNE